MAKIMVPVCLAACLIIALAAATYGADDKDNAVFERAKARKEIKKIEAIEAVEENERTRDQWETLAESYIKKLASKGASRLAPLKVQKYVETLSAAQKHQPDLSLTSLGMPAEWEVLLTVQEKSLACNKDLINTVAYFAVKGSKWQSDYAIEYFGQYLRLCGHQEHYKQAVDQFKNWDQDTYETLDSYLRGEFFSHKFTYVDETADRLGAFLSIFEQLAEFGSATACNSNQQLLDDLASVVFKSGTRVEYPQLYQLIEDYFESYLNKCGREESLVKALAEHGVAVDGTLKSYLQSEFAKTVVQKEKSAAKAILFALQIVNNSIEGKTSCNAVVLSIRRNLANVHKRSYYEGYKQYFSNVLKDHSAACAREFKARAETFREEHQDESAFIGNVIKTIEKEIVDDKLANPGQSRKVIEFQLHSLINDIKSNQKDFSGSPIETKDFVENFSNSCKVLFKHMEPFIEALSYDYSSVNSDEEILNFINYLGYCSFRDMNVLPDLELTVRDMFKKLNVPSYPEGAEFAA